MRIISFFLLFAPFLSLHSEFREFTAADGRTMIAQPINVIGDKILIERQDGHSVTTEISLFSAADQAYLKSWMFKKLRSEGRLVEVKAKRQKGRGIREKKDLTSSSGTLLKGALKIHRYPAYYEISVNNKSDMPLNNLKLEYRLFLSQEDIAAQSKEDKKFTRKKGTVNIALIQPKDTQTFETKKLEIVETELKSGLDWSTGGDEESKGRLVGVWIKIFQGGGELLGELASPQTLSSREEW